MHTHTLIGNFKTQAISNIISSICAIVLIFSTWQYTLNPPTCCPRESDNSTLFTDEGGGCEELQRDILLSNLNLHIPPSINITTSIIALVVCEAIYDTCTVWWESFEGEKTFTNFAILQPPTKVFSTKNFRHATPIYVIRFRKSFLPKRFLPPDPWKFYPSKVSHYTVCVNQWLWLLTHSPLCMHVHTYTAVFNQHRYALDTECVRCRSVWRWRRKRKSILCIWLHGLLLQGTCTQLRNWVLGV